MIKLWLSLGLINLLIAVVIYIDQVLRFGVWWEWDEFFHHEAFIGIFLYATLILFTMALIKHTRNLKRRAEQ